MNNNQDFITTNQDDNIDDSDISDAHYQVLLSLFDNLSADIQTSIKKKLQLSRDLRISKFNQNLVMQLPKHMLLSFKSKNLSESLRLPLHQKFYVFDVNKKEKYCYTNLNEIDLTPFEVSKVKAFPTKLHVMLEPKNSIKITNNIFDLWINPELWKNFGYALNQLRDIILENKRANATIEFDDGYEKEVQVSFESNDSYGLELNDRILLKLLSPEFILGIKLCLEEIPSHDDTDKIKSITFNFSIDLGGRREFLDIIQNSEKMFVNNIIPIFNLFDDFSTTQVLDGRYDKIPLIHPEETNTKPFYVHQIWVNDKNYKNYHNHIISEYIFHKHIGKLSYYPSNIQSSVQSIKKVFAKAFWTQNSTHEQLVRISTNSFSMLGSYFDVISYKRDFKPNVLSHVDQIVQLFRAFSDLDIRKTDGFYFALEFLYGSSNHDDYKKFRSAVKTIDYDYYSNTIHIVSNHQSKNNYLKYVSGVVADFFYANSPQVIEIRVFVEN